MRVHQFIVLCLLLICTARAVRADAPPGMQWIPGGEFVMGTNDLDSFPNERPAHRVRVDGLFMDVHDVTNAEFRRFVEATGYVTTAEKPENWQELKQELPPGTPKPDDSLLAPDRWYSRRRAMRCH